MSRAIPIAEIETKNTIQDSLLPLKKANANSSIVLGTPTFKVKNSDP